MSLLEKGVEHYSIEWMADLQPLTLTSYQWRESEARGGGTREEKIK